MKLRWPPPPLGLGTPCNLAALSTAGRTVARDAWWLIIVLGVATPLAMLGLDQILFEGSSLVRVRELGARPLGVRLLIVLYSAVTEELVYRLGVATLVAWLVFVSLPRENPRRKGISQWTGILVAALLFGLG